MEREAEARIKAAIIESEKSAKAARDWLEKCRRAGIDVSKQEPELIKTESGLKRMRAVFIEGK